MLSIIFFILGILKLSDGFSGILYLLIGLIWMIIPINSRKNGYFKIMGNQLIMKNILKSKIVNLNQLIKVEYLAGDYVLGDSVNEIRIVKEEIDKEDLARFEEIFYELKMGSIGVDS